MYVPTDLDIPDHAPKETKREAKLLRERALRLGRERVNAGLTGWQRTFSGETGRPYFQIGYVKREEGWLDKLPKRTLCESAQNARPKSADAVKAKAKSKSKQKDYRNGL
jgi:hypothetical protein